MGFVSLFTQGWAIKTGHANWQTMVFTVLCLSQMGHVLAVRFERESLFGTRDFYEQAPLRSLSFYLCTADGNHLCAVPESGFQDPSVECIRVADNAWIIDNSLLCGRSREMDEKKKGNGRREGRDPTIDKCSLRPGISEYYC